MMAAEAHAPRLGWLHGRPVDAGDNLTLARAKSLLAGVEMRDGRPYVDDLTVAQARDVLRYCGVLA